MTDLKQKRWLNRNIVGMGITSFFSDFGHEMITAILPAFIISLGGNAATLGLIEGFSDMIMSGGKVLSGWLSDKWQRRKGLMGGGYSLTALGIGGLLLVGNIGSLFAARMVMWFGRGFRESPRDSLMLAVSEKKNYGKVFGFNRTLDTFGAVCGPVVAYFFLSHHASFRAIFLLALIPTILAVITVLSFVRETHHAPLRRSFKETVTTLPTGFWWFMIGIGVYGFGDFADSLMVLRATTLLSPAHGLIVAASLAALLYVIHNIFYAFGSAPVGFLGDKFGKLPVLITGMVLTAIGSIGFAFTSSSLIVLGGCFVIAGLGIAAADALEDAVPGDLLDDSNSGTGYGILAAVNGIGDFASSAMVGLLIVVVSPMVGFLYAAIFCLIGAGLLVLLPILKPKPRGAQHA